MNELFGEFAIASMLPIALKIGADADFRAPMAIAIIGGLTTSIKTRRFHAARKVDLQLA